MKQKTIRERISDHRPGNIPDPGAAEISWFAALCSDDYQFLGVPDDHVNPQAVVLRPGLFQDFRDTEKEAQEYADYIVSKLGYDHGRHIRERALDATSPGVSHQATRTGAWVRSRLEHKPTRLVTVAVANKTARTAWALLAKGESYKATPGSCQTNANQSQYSQSRQIQAVPN